MYFDVTAARVYLHDPATDDFVPASSTVDRSANGRPTDPVA
jgi:hypothetical protein